MITSTQKRNNLVWTQNKRELK